MLHFLLGHPEAYTSATFQRLYVADLLHQASALFTSPAPHAAPPPPSFLLAPPDSQSPAIGSTPVRLIPQALDYLHRGASLGAWPLYFYVAGVRRCPRRALHAGLTTVPFEHAHPLSASHVQVVSLHTAWSVPVVAGASLPDPALDAVAFARLALLLAKPWREPTLRDLLQPLASDSPQALPSWPAALDDFELALAARSPRKDAARRPPPFSARYWAERSVDLLQNLRNTTAAPAADANQKAVRVNPDAAAGLPGSIELPGVAPAPEPGSPRSALPSDDDASPTFSPTDTAAHDPPSPIDADLSTVTLSWQDVLDSALGVLSGPDSFRSHFISHANYRFPTSASQASAAPSPCPLPPHLAQHLLDSETDWAAVLPLPDAPTSSFPTHLSAPSAVLDTVRSWLDSGRCNQADGQLNLKQAAMLILHALWLHDILAHRRSFSTRPVPCQRSVLLGGPGTGKSYVLRLLSALNDLYLPGASRICAPMHTAARLIGGRALHSALCIPLEPLTSKKSLWARAKRSSYLNGFPFALFFSMKSL